MATVDVFYQYIQKEPALCIGRRRFNRGVSYVLLLSRAHEILDMPGRQKDAGLMECAMNAARVLGIETKAEIYDIADLITNCMDYLCKMPEWEMVEKELTKQVDVGHEANLTVDGETVLEIDASETVRLDHDKQMKAVG